MSNKVFDVTRPGKSAPSNTSKSVIISNRPVLKDPMMVDEDKKDKAEDTTVAPMMVTSKIKVEPIHDHVVPDEDDGKQPTDAEDSGRKDEGTDEATTEDISPIKLGDQDDKTESESQADKKAPQVNKDEPADDSSEADEAPKSESQTAANSEPTDQTSQAAQEKINEVADRKAAERAAEIQKLALSHKYYLPINQVEKRRNKRAAWAGIILVLLLAVVWADVALDAGLVTIPGVKPPTHFFK